MRLPVCLAFVLSLCASGAAAERAILVFAAASLGPVIEDAAEGWAEAGGAPVTVSAAGTSVLARQIQAGAPADLFLSASADWMDVLEAEGLLREGTRRDLLGNRLVLVRHGEGAAPVEIAPGFDLATELDGGRLAMALVAAVPAGIYGREALVSLGLWDAVADRLAETDNVRSALALVAAGEAPAAVVYATDALAEPGVSVIGTFPADSHAPIVYPAAVLEQSDHAQAEAFLAYLGGVEALEVFEAAGFSVVAR